MVKDIQQVHICAWCKNYIVNGIRIDSIDIPVDSIDSHGICINCAYAVEAAYCVDDTET